MGFYTWNDFRSLLMQALHFVDEEVKAQISSTILISVTVVG
jgi:hypothetical protein